jgi:hypothetical protein
VIFAGKGKHVTYTIQRFQLHKPEGIWMGNLFAGHVIDISRNSQKILKKVRRGK